MNLELFSEIMTGARPWQQPKEWRTLFEFAHAYFNNRRIDHPVVVELGSALNRQKKFYEQLLGAQHISIDIRGEPDIRSNTHDAGTLIKLKEMLDGRLIDLLFIDASHYYADVKRDYEIYEPLTRYIIAFHDIFLEREEVRLFWDELTRKEKRYLKLTINCWNSGQKLDMGIGLILKE